jgi:hypothetical protein
MVELVSVRSGTAAAWYAARTVRAINREITETKKAADAARESADAAKDTLATNQEIERAYISITHQNVHIVGSDDGMGGSDRTKPVAISFTVRARNTGRTPGDLLGGYFGFAFGDVPKTPDLLSGSRLPPAFLYPDKHIEFTWTIWTARFPQLTSV